MGQILNIVNDYENDNLQTIKKLRKEKSITIKRINGGIRQTINAHGPVTKLLIGSCSKRIYGSLLVNEDEVKKPKKVSIKILIIGVLLGSISTLLLTLLF